MIEGGNNTVGKIRTPSNRSYLDNNENNKFTYYEDHNMSLSSQSAEQWNLEGNVHFRGNPCPPSAFSTVPPCSGPYPNYEIVVYTEDGKTVASKAKTDANGKFKILLKSGKYLIKTRTGPSSTDIKSIQFTITKYRITQLGTLVVDTGLE